MNSHVTPAKAKPVRVRAARMDASARRETILESSWDLIRTRGLSECSLEAVADHAGISKALIYKHFVSRNDLLAELMRREFEVIRLRGSAAYKDNISLEEWYIRRGELYFEYLKDRGGLLETLFEDPALFQMLGAEARQNRALSEDHFVRMVVESFRLPPDLARLGVRMTMAAPERAVRMLRSGEVSPASAAEFRASFMIGGWLVTAVHFSGGQPQNGEPSSSSPESWPRPPIVKPAVPPVGLADAEHRQRAPRMDKDDRREQILDAACEIIATRGLSECSLEEIAVALNISKALVYKLFPNREDLLGSLMDRELELFWERDNRVMPYTSLAIYYETLFPFYFAYVKERGSILKRLFGDPAVYKLLSDEQRERRQTTRNQLLDVIKKTYDLPDELMRLGVTMTMYAPDAAEPLLRSGYVSVERAAEFWRLFLLGGWMATSAKLRKVHDPVRPATTTVRAPATPPRFPPSRPRGR